MAGGVELSFEGRNEGLTSWQRTLAKWRHAKLSVTGDMHGTLPRTYKAIKASAHGRLSQNSARYERPL